MPKKRAVKKRASARPRTTAPRTSAKEPAPPPAAEPQEPMSDDEVIKSLMPPSGDFPIKIRDRELLFVKLYKAIGDPVKCAKKAGLSRGQANELIKRTPELSDDVAALLESCGVTKRNVVTELRRIALADPGQMFDETDEILPVRRMPEDIRRALSGVDVTRVHRVTRQGDHEDEVTVKPRMWDKPGALRDLARMLKLVDGNTLRVGNVPGETFDTKNDAPKETREQIMASLLSLIAPKPDPK